MKKVMKRAISYVLIIAMLLALPFSVRAKDTQAQANEDTQWSYNLDDMSLTIWGTGAMVEGAPWFGYKDQVKTLIIQGVTSVADNAFEDFNVLESVQIDSTVQSIGAYAFFNCSKLTDITIGTDVRKIGTGAFEYTGFYNDEANWVDEILYLDSYILHVKPTATGEITIGEGTTLIADRAFYACADVTMVMAMKDLKYFGSDIFHGCSSLIGMWISVDNPYLCSDENGAVYNKEQTELLLYPTAGNITFEIPSTVTKIADYALQDCVSLKTVTVPEGVTSIGGYAFAGCISLTEIALPSTLNELGSYAFASCSSLAQLQFGGLSRIPMFAFSACTALQTITIPDSVTYIEDNAFSSCTVLESVSMGENVSKIGYDVFKDTAFYNNSANWSAGALFIGNYLIKADASVVAGDYVVKDGTTLIAGRAFMQCKNLNTLTIPSSVRYIGESAFHLCSSITGITFEEGVEIIDARAFMGCSALNVLTIPNSVKEIGERAFSDCTNLMALGLGTGVKVIGGSSFANCSTLTSVTLPASVTSVDIGAFGNCEMLTGIWVDAENTAFSSDENGALYDIGKKTLLQVPGGLSGAFEVPEGVETIRASAFYCCKYLTEVSLPESLSMIESAAFANCVALEAVYFAGQKITEGGSGSDDPNLTTGNLHTIENAAFINCSALTSIVLPYSVEKIGYNAFCDCTSMTSVTVYNPNCDIYRTEKTLGDPSVLTEICGYANSTAQFYAELFNIPFTALGCQHSYVPILTVEPTCLNVGYTLYECSICLGEKNDDFQEATGHDYQLSEELLATCTVAGYEIYTCTACADSYQTDIAALGHSFEVKEIVEATCQQGGYTIYECSTCQETKQDDLTEVTEHNYVVIATVEATCTTDGYKTYECTMCQDRYDGDQVAALGHSYEVKEIVEATCQQGGVTIYECNACGDLYNTDETLPIDHEFVVIQTVPATCSTEGFTVYQCTMCGETYNDDFVTLGRHNFENGICTLCEKPEPRYRDVDPGDWYYGAVEFVTDYSLMEGVSKDYFAPDAPMTRAMLVTVLWRSEGKPTIGSNVFTDVKNDFWYTDAISWGTYHEIVKGFGNRIFSPDGTITREQIATILFRYSEFLDYGTEGRASLSAFPDAGRVSDWASEALSWAVAKGLIAGTENGGRITLDPQGYATRAQVATILMRFIEQNK